MRKVGYGFELTAYEPIDGRLVLTKEQMKQIVGDETSDTDYAMPEVYFALCSDDGQWYRFDYGFDLDTGDPIRTPDPETGYFTKMELGGNTPTSDSGPVASRPEASAGEVGDKWFDPETDKTYTIVNDSQGAKTWVETTATVGEMTYDATNDKFLYFDGTEWKEIGGGIAKETSVDTTTPGTSGEMVYDETTKEYKIYEPAASGESSGVWLNMAKVWEGTETEYTALGGDTWSTNHPDVLCFIK